MATRGELTARILDHTRDQLASGARLLDVGCGMGWCLEALAAAGAKPGTLHGVDMDSARVDAARCRVPGASIEVADARSLPYGDCTFSVVLLLVTLSSMGRSTHVVAALQESRRVLASGGVLLVYEPRLPNPLSPNTRVVRDDALDEAGLIPRTQRTLTLIPQIGRRLGPLTPSLHPILSAVPVLRSHRLLAYQAPHG